ncbi:phytanoyl-CoA dioxygenase family protein [Nostoc sp.]|uniref:phytanoyl-CoA dioxygenase family protein n=1 Tax=Nostoc sp. TaxID=1180 RepID=UPI002FFB9B03
MNLSNLETKLAEQGWAVIDLPDPTPVLNLQNQLLQCLQDMGLMGLQYLKDYHHFICENAQHLQLNHDLMTRYWNSDRGKQIITANLAVFRYLIGPDLIVQNYSYLRIVRPGQAEDATPLHRDTYYGASPYELSVLIPLTPMDVNNGLRVISGSHLAPDSAYPYHQHISQEVTPGSPRHQLGFPYAPRLLAAELNQQTQPVALEVGQVLIFGLSLIHGGGVNHSQHTRFSTDIRVANLLAPVTWQRGVHRQYFVPLQTSAITRTAQQYLQVNQVEAIPELETSPLLLECIDPCQDPRWLSLLEHPSATLFHSPAWLRVLRDTYGFKIQAYVVTDGANLPLSGLPFCEVKDLIEPRLVCLPFTDACDPLLSNPDHWTILFRQLQSHQMLAQVRCLESDIVARDPQLTLKKRAC